MRAEGEKAMLDFLAKGLMVIILLAWVFRRERNGPRFCRT
jgi:hypothetical protein